MLIIRFRKWSSMLMDSIVRFGFRFQLSPMNLANFFTFMNCVLIIFRFSTLKFLDKYDFSKRITYWFSNLMNESRK